MTKDIMDSEKISSNSIFPPMMDDGTDTGYTLIIPMAKQLEGYERYYQFIVRLTDSNVDDYIDLPMIAMMGDTSFGKSSLLLKLSLVLVGLPSAYNAQGYPHIGKHGIWSCSLIVWLGRWVSCPVFSTSNQFFSLLSNKIENWMPVSIRESASEKLVQRVLVLLSALADSSIWGVESTPLDLESKNPAEKK